MTPWTVAHLALLSVGFSRQEYWSGLPFPSPGDLPDPEIELWSPALRADYLPSESPGKDNGMCDLCELVRNQRQLAPSIFPPKVLILLIRHFEKNGIKVSYLR